MMERNRSDHLSILDHVIELRSRVILSISAIVINSSIAHFFHEQIIHFLLKPIGSQQLIFLSPLDPLFFILKIDFAVGILLSLPIIMWCFLSYIRPAITKKVSRVMYIIYTFSSLSVLASISYAYYIVVPITLKFLSSIVVSGIQNTISAQSYLSFFITQILIITLIFQIPLFIVFGIYVGIFSTKWLSQKRGYIYVGAAIALSILTPTPDIFSLCMVLVPTFVIFEGSLVVGKVLELLKKRRA